MCASQSAPSATVVPEALRAAVAAWPQAAMIVDPRAARLVAGNAAARADFPALTATQGLALDGAMPAVRRLREIVRSESDSAAPVALVFWTARGARTLLCRLERVTGAGGPPLVGLFEVGGGPAAPAPDAIAGAAVPSPPPAAPPLSDTETLREIARRIREGRPGQGGSEPVADGPPGAVTPSAPPAIDVARLAHELKTPLSAIQAAAEIIKDARFGPIGNERYAGYVTDIHASAQHALHLIERMLHHDTDTPEAGARQLRFERLRLDELVDGCLSAVRPLAASRGVVVITERSATPPHVTVDATSLKQIVLNLLTNAIKFTPPRGSIRVSTVGSREGTAVLTVADTGPGMSAETIAEALRPVPPVAPPVVPAARAGGGFGIGLPLSRALAEANGAHLTIESAPGAGTRVTVTFAKGRLIAL